MLCGKSLVSFLCANSNENADIRIKIQNSGNICMQCANDVLNLLQNQEALKFTKLFVYDFIKLNMQILSISRVVLCFINLSSNVLL